MKTIVTLLAVLYALAVIAFSIAEREETVSNGAYALLFVVGLFVLILAISILSEKIEAKDRRQAISNEKAQTIPHRASETPVPQSPWSV